MVWHQFGTVQFPSHQFLRKLRPVQFGARGPSASVQFRTFSSVHEFLRPDSEWPGWLGSVHWISICLGGVRSSSRSPPAEIPARRPRVCHLDGDMVRFAGCACLPVRGVVWCRSHANSVQKRFKKSSFSSDRLPDRVDYQSFKSVSGTGAKCLHSVHSVQFTNSSGLGLDLTRAPVGAGEILSPIPDFLDSSKMEADIDAKFSVPSPASIWCLSLKFQEISVDNWIKNDILVTSCFAILGKKDKCLKAARMFSFEVIHNLKKPNNVKLNVLQKCYIRFWYLSISTQQIKIFDFSKTIDCLIRNFQ